VDITKEGAKICCTARLVELTNLYSRLISLKIGGTGGKVTRDVKSTQKF
jgi:hypothetical protein